MSDLNSELLTDKFIIYPFITACAHFDISAYEDFAKAEIINIGGDAMFEVENNPFYSSVYIGIGSRITYLKNDANFYKFNDRYVFLLREIDYRTSCIDSKNT